MTAAVRFDGVGKRFGDVAAVQEVTLTVEPGEVHALVGLNGAGKTTLIRMLLGMVTPTSGSVEVLGHRLPDRRVWSDVGYLVESPAAYPELTVRENLEVVRRLRRLPDARVVHEAIERFDLGRYADRRARTLSLGNAQRLGLAKALMHRPTLLVLDEPVNGLDPAGVVEVREMLVDLAREQGTTVLLSSHLLGEVARSANRVTVLHEGRLVDDFPTAALDQRVRRHLEVSAADGETACRILQQAGWAPQYDGRVIRLVDPSVIMRPEVVATALVHGGSPPTRLTLVEEDLESYFLRLVGVLHEPAPPSPLAVEASGAW